MPQFMTLTTKPWRTDKNRSSSPKHANTSICYSTSTIQSTNMENATSLPLKVMSSPSEKNSCTRFGRRKTSSTVRKTFSDWRKQTSRVFVRIPVRQLHSNCRSKKDICLKYLVSLNWRYHSYETLTLVIFLLQPDVIKHINIFTSYNLSGNKFYWRVQVLIKGIKVIISIFYPIVYKDPYKWYVNYILH